jgi:hypothetical protein
MESSPEPGQSCSHQCDGSQASSEFWPESRPLLDRISTTPLSLDVRVAPQVGTPSLSVCIPPPALGEGATSWRMEKVGATQLGRVRCCPGLGGRLTRLLECRPTTDSDAAQLRRSQS